MTDKGDSQGHSALDDLSVDPSALEGDPFARRAPAFSSLRSSGRAWVAAAIAIGVLFVGWQFREPLSSEVTRAPAVSGPTLLRAADPSALKQQIVDELHASGVDAIGYDRLGLSGVDARLPEPIPAPVRATLEKHGIATPADGVMRVEITAAK